MSKVLEIQNRLKKIDEAEYFPSACVDIAEKLIRNLASAEFRIVGSIELAWRRGFQAGLLSQDMGGFTNDTLNKLSIVLNAVGVRGDMIYIDADSIIEPVTGEVRRMAGDLLDLVEGLEIEKGLKK